ncbi:MAG: tRNA (N6-isopentenyl adenosine(37)-C2)-methylthiotransferase MiaB [Chrysiogenetes bacterium]|nr:tRNA (N6-isopentenyl adenosine(37)-C2)-methylthiotransferase MiaB [Chrysiogenetes bacterium]
MSERSAQPGSPELSAAEAEDLDRVRVAGGARAASETNAEAAAGGKRLYLETYGCQMNDRDSDTLVSLLAAHGYGLTDDPAVADLICVNTCSVRAKAEDKTWSELGRYRVLKEENPALRIAMVGCVAQQVGEDAVGRARYLDLVVGTHNIHALPEMLAERERTGRPVVRADFHAEEQKIFRPAEIDASGRLQAFVNIMVGCDHQCTYCIVPMTRGPEISRAPGDVLSEVRALAGQGVKEIMLLGQNVNSYGKQWAHLGKEGGPDFGELVFEVAKVEGVERIRFTSPHPMNVGETLYRAFAACEKLQPHIHLPLQSGSDAVLRRMKREYKVEKFLEVVEKLRAARPGISITTDIIVGFPGESSEDYEATLAVMERVRFDGAYSFAYSKRPGTPALKLDGDVPAELAKERLRRLQSLQEEISAEVARNMVGRVEQVLVEGRSRRREDQVSGRAGSNWTVNFDGPPSLIGQVVAVEITEGLPHTLRGRLV